MGDSLTNRGLEIVQKEADQHLRHDLDNLAGTWSADEASEFRQATAQFDEIDPTLWQYASTSIELML
ncbi:MAG: hypothetical protein AVDCRST_MAG93-2414 [uncultured Chloroflexia bacterium]|uniref:Uncharacterized protein n=1 Tax=uncultured Chloroflexia bacterium TaxID=1672391 RepID=A0A6J4J216_9CHLR|nr:MAG: hypothetical protein AVDCRST_MAG93-2414 [uncultured Chloroflexia bacterium]